MPVSDDIIKGVLNRDPWSLGKLARIIDDGLPFVGGTGDFHGSETASAR